MNEKNTQVKITMPLIDDIELQNIDTFYNDIVSEYTKAFVKEKEQVISQRLMMNLQKENTQLKDKIDRINKLLNEPIFEYDNIPCNIENEIIQLKDILKEN